MVRRRTSKSRGTSTRDLALAAVAKRGKRERDAEEDRSRQKGDEDEEDDQLVFEDPYDDEFENDDEEGEEDDDDGDDVDDGDEGKEEEGQKRVFRPGEDRLRADEVLVYDKSTYEMLHRLNVDWPCLSFDILRENCSSSYPMMMHMVSGTQADKKGRNKISLCKMSNLYRTRKKTRRADDDEMSESSSDSDSENGDCILEHQDVVHDGVVNRIRSMPQRPGIVSTWSESGKVYVFDVEPCIEALNRGRRMPNPGAITASKIKPFFTFSGHSTEGFAMDWSRQDQGKLLTGDCKHDIFLSEMQDDGFSFQVDSKPFSGHQESVEDLQWSPSESTVFASCSVDKSIKFWDTRERRKAALSLNNAHSQDINVISWNPIDSHLLLSGCDAGTMRVWDLRSVKSNAEGSKPAADFSYHKKAITSVEWHPSESSMLAASSEDDSISIWDLAVERDPEEEARLGNVLPGTEGIPAQLMFIHMGQAQIKEIHWHCQIPTMLVSTARDGFNVLCPAEIF